MTLPRNNGKVRACAECRRLKLRCDRNFPCQACVRRGCSSICPDKCFTDKPTPSSLKANTLRSREQIEALQARITALENALGQEIPSHPLISPKGSPSSVVESIDESDDLLEEADILGNLTIAEDGSTIFKGAVDGSKPLQGLCFPDHYLLSAGDQPNLPNSIQLLSALFPFTPHHVASAASMDDFIPFLPPAEVAFDIVTRYWYLFTIHSPICHTQFMKSIYDPIYPLGTQRTCHLVRADAHRLGLLFITLALGVLSDGSKAMLSLEAETYYQLARAALSVDPVCDNTTVHSLQCMLLMGWYTCMAPNRTSHGYEWAFRGIIIKLASSIGIFRDSRKWLSDPDEILEREILCWEIICAEVWAAFCHGRPSCIDLSLVDCPRPSDASMQLSAPPSFIPGYHSWKYSFYSLISEVLLVVLRPKAVKYSEILVLERKLRDCTMPPELEVPLHGSPLQGVPEDATSVHFQRFTALVLREMTSCMLHRRFLVLAMETGSVDLEHMPFKYSALRAGHSARWIITSQITMYRRYPELISRVPVYWSASFSAAVVMGALATRYADRDFARCALVPFESICALFEETAGVSIQPPLALESLQRLQKRVRAEFSAVALSKPSSNIDNNCGEYLLQCMESMSLPKQAQSKSQCSPPKMKTSGSDSSKENSPGLPTLSGCPGDSVAGTPVPQNHVLDPATASWPEFDITYPLEDTYSIPADLPRGNNQGAPFPWPEGISNSGLGDAVIGSSVAEVGQWDQFLDNLGVWD